MLRVGLSGGIGSGKSTVARRLVELGAVLIDSDVIARQVVEPGTEGLAEIVERFGAEILDANGALDRPAMARRVFDDDAARAELNAIVHPRVRARTAELAESAPADSIVVHDVPLLVEAGYAPNYHLVLIVDAPVQRRVARLIERGLDESDARARIKAQATEEQRRAVADVWLDNSGDIDELYAVIDRLWRDRLVPFERNVRLRRPAEPASRALADDERGRTAERLRARIERAVGQRASVAAEDGPTSMPGIAENAIGLRVTAPSPADAEALAEPLGDAGFPRLATSDAADSETIHAAADPDQPAVVRVRLAESR